MSFLPWTSSRVAAFFPAALRVLASCWTWCSSVVRTAWFGGAGTSDSAQVVKAWSSWVVPWAFVHWAKWVSAVCFWAVSSREIPATWESVNRAGGGFCLMRSVADSLAVFVEAADAESWKTTGGARPTTAAVVATPAMTTYCHFKRRAVIGHKMYVPKGVAALRTATVQSWNPCSVYGGGQQRGLRAGTENIALTVALGTAAELAGGGPEHMARLPDRLHARLVDAFPASGAARRPVEPRLPDTLNVMVDSVLGHELLTAVPEIAASAGSACHNSTHAPSPVRITDKEACARRGCRAEFRQMCPGRRWHVLGRVTGAAAARAGRCGPGHRRLHPPR
ncbi:aminotransferase class V-fold PLP-dependent enzyme [Streptomyces sp. NPDC050549]|uniref:aminotransferase class V-fold PLP-dependent enzyme n=1 Tax=Streptomyces sp. NPDC050549 TaxID=3155406 RepID=UPI0034123D69